MPQKLPLYYIPSSSTAATLKILSLVLMEEIVIPRYFLCPISLQIMKDPVTTMTGISYDRESIEKWLSTSNCVACPVTNQPLETKSELLPNHTLRRLIQAWCSENVVTDVDFISSPEAPINRTHLRKLVGELRNSDSCSVNALKKLDEIATKSERNRKIMEQTGLVKEIICFIMQCFNERKTLGLFEALTILNRIWNSQAADLKLFLHEIYSEFTSSFTWILSCRTDRHILIKSQAVEVLKNAIFEVADPNLVENLPLDFFKTISKLLGEKISESAMKATLLLLTKSCPSVKNRIKIVQSGAVFELIELELEKQQKNITELIFNLLTDLCSIAEGREELLKHAGCIAMVSKRILRVSAATDDRALHLLSLISKCSASRDVLQEMLMVGAVAKLCMVMQADSDAHLKEKARAILRSHSRLWTNSPCISVYLLTRDPR